MNIVISNLLNQALNENLSSAIAIPDKTTEDELVIQFFYTQYNYTTLILKLRKGDSTRTVIKRLKTLINTAFSYDAKRYYLSLDSDFVSTPALNKSRRLTKLQKDTIIKDIALLDENIKFIR